MTLNIAKPPHQSSDDSISVPAAQVEAPPLLPQTADEAKESEGVDPTQPITITMDALTEYANAYKMIQEGKKQEGRLLKPPSAMTKVFVTAIRNAVLSKDQPKGLYENLRITPCLHDDTDKFTKKANNFMDMCSSPVRAGANEEVEEGTSRPGHIKIEQAFRPKGNFVEGWIFIRWMEVGWRAGGFKAHRLGSLPLVMFTKDDDNETLRDCLDSIMEEVYPVLVECFPHCHIVPIKTCAEHWGANERPISKEGSELREALQRAQCKKDGDSSEFSVRSSAKSASARKLKSSSNLDASIATNTTNTAEDLEAGVGDMAPSSSADAVDAETEANSEADCCEPLRNCTFQRPSAFQIFACWSTSVLIAILFVVYGALFGVF